MQVSNGLQTNIMHHPNTNVAFAIDENGWIFEWKDREKTSVKPNKHRRSKRIEKQEG